MDSNYVAMGQHICPVCTETHDSDEILVNLRLSPIPQGKRITGWKMCPEHQLRKDEGYIAMIEIDPKYTTDYTLQGVHRTGRLMHIKQEVAAALFNVKQDHRGIGFIDALAFNKVQAMYEEDMNQKGPY